MTTKPSDPPPPALSAGDGRPGFIADLAFTLIVPWLILWRIELPAGHIQSIWTGWWPALMVGILLTVALVVGRSQRNPRGFLPYRLRWVLLTAVLVLPAWIGLSIVDAANSRPRLQSGAAAIRREVERELTTSTRPDEQPELRQALAATEDADKLAKVLEAADAAQIATPQAAIEAPLDAQATADPTLHDEAQKNIGLAESLEAGNLPSGDLAEMTEEAGLDEAKMLAALLVLAAALLAPLLGLSPAVTMMLLKTLVADGELSVGGALRVAYAMHESALPDGTFDEQKLLKDFERFDVLVEDAQRIAQTAKKVGGSSPGLEAIEKVAKPAKPHDACLIEHSKDLKGNSSKQIETELRQRCPSANPTEIKAKAKKLSRGRK